MAGTPDDEERKARARARARRWYLANKPRAAEARKRNYSPEKAAAYNRDYRKRNAERLAAYDNTQERRERVARWIRDHPEWNRERASRRRAIIAGRPTERIDPVARYTEDAGICGLCGDPVGRDTFTLDHIVPIANGGAHVWANVHTAHRGCNSAKGVKVADILYSL